MHGHMGDVTSFPGELDDLTDIKKPSSWELSDTNLHIDNSKSDLKGKTYGFGEEVLGVYKVNMTNGTDKFILDGGFGLKRPL